MAAAEVAPLARTGGLGDVLGSLPRYLSRRGIEVGVIMPGHRAALRSTHRLQDTGWKVTVPVSSRWEEGRVLRASLGDGVSVYLVRADRYFDRPELYGEHGRAYPDNAERFVFFNRAVLAVAELVGVPDIFHVHDWHAALVPVFLRADAARYPWAGPTRSVLTIHNIAYQGDFWPLDWHLLNLDGRYFSFDALEAWGRVNFLKGGISFADAITTVSPTYAREIQTPEYGCGLDAALRYRKDRVFGILNGVDYELWDPRRDPFLPAHYGLGDIGGKRVCKQKLLETFGLRIPLRAPLAGVVARLVEQKGIDLLVEAIPAIVARGASLVVLGRGDPELEDALGQRQSEYAERMGLRIAFDDALAHQIEAGADLFLMPSRFEPCGLNQMYSQRYGTIPVVHATGGLVDTVIDADERPADGTGFQFRPCTQTAFLSALDRALRWYADAERWQALVERAMRQDFSWERSAERYHHLYAQLCATGEPS